MRYLPTLNLWDAGISSALRSGQLKLQVGQWIYCGDKEHKSRFVSINKIGYIDAVHWAGDSKRQLRNFLFRALSSKLNKQLDAGTITHKEFRDTMTGSRNLLIVKGMN